MIRFTGWFSEEFPVAVQCSVAETLRLASPQTTSSSRRRWSKSLRAAALFSVIACATSTASAQWTITDLGGLPGGFNESKADGVNNAGQVVGETLVPTDVMGQARRRAFLWQNGVMTNLGELPGGFNYSRAYGINNAGQVVGASEAATGPRAFLWQNGVMTNLGDLPGGGDYSDARGINNAGQVVGYSSAATGTRAFMWQNGVMTNLGDLPGGIDSSYARGINNAGQVVGDSDNRAFLWQDGVMTDLNTVSGIAGTGWNLAVATAINDAGQIVGYGNNPLGAESAFILTPVPEPEVYLMMGVGVCLAGVIARRRKNISQ